MSNAVKVKKLIKENEVCFMVAIGDNKLEVNKTKAELICRLLATWLGFEIVEKHKVKRLRDANANHTKDGKIK